MANVAGGPRPITAQRSLSLAMGEAPVRTQPARRASSLSVAARTSSGIIDDGMQSEDGEDVENDGASPLMRRNNSHGSHHSSPLHPGRGDHQAHDSLDHAQTHHRQPFAGSRRPFQPESLQAHLHSALQRSMHSPSHAALQSVEAGGQTLQVHQQQGFGSMLLSPPPPQGLSMADLEIRQLRIPPAAVTKPAPSHLRSWDFVYCCRLSNWPISGFACRSIVAHTADWVWCEAGNAQVVSNQQGCIRRACIHHVRCSSYRVAAVPEVAP